VRIVVTPESRCYWLSRWEQNGNNLGSLRGVAGEVERKSEANIRQIDCQ
jgi:hypothetical protein